MPAGKRHTMALKAKPLSGLLLLFALFILLPGTGTGQAGPAFNGSSGSWQDDFSDASGVSSSSWTSVSGGALKLTQNPPSSYTETTQAQFNAGTLTRMQTSADGTFKLADPSYVETLAAQTFTNRGSDKAQGWKGDDDAHTYNFPAGFTFPFYGTTYSQVQVEANGFLCFANCFGLDADSRLATAQPYVANPTPSARDLQNMRAIAHYWADIEFPDSDDDIYIETGSGWVAIQWRGNAIADGSAINIEVVLYSDGRHEFHYGSGNTLASGDYVAGISRGNDADYVLSSHHGKSNLTNAQTASWNSQGVYISPSHNASAPNQDKTFTRISWNTAALPSGAGVQMDYSVDGGAYQPAGTQSTAGSTSGSAIISATGKAIRYRATLSAPRAEATPVLQDVTVDYNYVGYRTSGSAVSATIPPSGPVAGWATLRYSKSVPSGTTLTVDVLDASGNALLSDIADGGSLAGIDAAANPTIKLRANFTTTNTSVTPSLDTWSVDYDPTRPTVSVTTPSDPAVGTITLAYTVSDPDTGPAGLAANPASVFYQVEGQVVWYQVARNQSTSGYSLDTGKLPDGRLKFRVTAVDGYGLSGAGDSGFITVDNSASSSDTPSVTITAPAAGAFWSGTRTVEYSASDPEGTSMLYSVYYSTDETTWYLVSDSAFGVSLSGPPFSFSWNTRTVADSPPQYKVRVTALDGAKVMGLGTSGAFSVDNGPPTFAVSVSANPAKAGNTTVTVTASESLGGPPTVTVTQNGRSPVSVTVAGSGKTWSGTYTVVSGYDGQATISVSGSDLAGNTGATVTSGATFTVDTVAPAAPSVSSPSDNQVFTGSPITLSGTAEGGSQVSLTLNDSSASTQTALDSGSFTFESVAITLSHNRGYNSLALRATDAAGNQSPATTLTVKLNAPPTLAFTYPQGGETLKGQPQITWTAGDPNDDALRFSLEYDDGEGKWTELGTRMEGAGFFWNTPDVADGNNYRLRLSTSDGTAEVTVVSARFSVDNDLPAISLTPLSPDPTNDNTPSLSGRAVSAVTKVTIRGVEHTLDDGAGWSQASPTDGKWGSRSEYFTFTLGPLKDGVHTVQVRSLDSKGHYTARSEWASDTFTIDTVPPAPPRVTSPKREAIISDKHDTQPKVPGTQISIAGSAEAKSLIELAVGGKAYQATASAKGMFTIAGVSLGHRANNMALTATDVAGNTSKKTSYRVFHNNAPSVRFLAPRAGEHWGGAKTVRWIGSDKDGDDITVYGLRYRDGGSDWVGLASGLEIPEYSWRTAAVPDGVYTLEAAASDGLSVGHGRALVTIDNTAPGAPQVTWPERGQVVGDGEDTRPLEAGVQITVRGLAEPSATVRLILGGKIRAGKASARGAFEVQGVTLSHGANRPYLAAVDLAGNSSPSVQWEIVHNNPPEPSFLSPLEGEAWSGERTVKWRASDPDGDKIAGYRLSYRGPSAQGVLAEIPSSSYTWDTRKHADGTYTLDLSASDGVSFGMAERRLLLDNTPPQVELRLLVPETTTDRTPLFGGEAVDGLTPIRYVEYSIDGGPWFRALIVEGLGAKKVRYRAIHPSPLSDGLHVLRTRATDGTGNVGFSSQVRVLVDTTAPRIGGNMFQAAQQILLPDSSGAVEVAEGSRVSIFLAVGGEPKEVRARVAAQEVRLDYDLASGLHTGTLRPEKPGRHPVLARAVDKLGNEAGRQVGVLLVDPAGRVYDVRSGRPIKGAEVTLHYFEPSTKSWVVWDAAAFGQRNPQLTDGAGRYRFMAPPGRYYLRAVAPGYAVFRGDELRVSASRPVYLDIPLGPGGALSGFSNNMPIISAAATLAGFFSLLGLILRGPFV